jgi:hypothetical protein
MFTATDLTMGDTNKINTVKKLLMIHQLWLLKIDDRKYLPKVYT